MIQRTNHLFADRRRFPRVSFVPPLPGTCGVSSVNVVNLCVAGALIEYAEPFPTDEPLCLSFDWYESIEVDTRVVRGEAIAGRFRSALEIIVPSAALVRSLALRISSTKIARLELLVQASKLINSSIEPDALVDSILTLAREELGVPYGAVYFVDHGKQEIWRELPGGGMRSARRFRLGTGVAGSVALTGKSLVLEDAYSDARFDGELDLVSGQRSGAMLCVPVLDRARTVIGVLQLVNERYRSFSEADLGFLHAISEHVAIAMRNAAFVIEGIEKNRMDAELRLASEIQVRLLPLAPTDWPGVEVAASSVPCFEVGGDYHDFIRLPKGDVGLAVGDVSGKGVAAALIMSSAQAALRIAAPSEPDLARLITRLDTLLLQTTSPGKFATFFFARYSRKTGVLRYVNAGHSAPFVCTGGHLLRLTATGPPLGLVSRATFREEKIELERGATLFLYTDGFHEALNPLGEELGMEGWEGMVRDAALLSVPEIVQKLTDGITRYESGVHPADDKTLVVFRRIE